MEAELLDDPAALAELAGAWDALAVANRLPLMAPAVVEAWWRHLAPAGAELRLAVVRDGDELAGVAPLWADGRELRLAGAGVFNRLAPLAAPGREAEVATALGQGLAATGADVLLLEGVPTDSPWPALLRDGLPGSRTFERALFPAPVAHLRPTFDDWMASRSKNFRGQMRRARRDLEQAGGETRAATPETLRADLEALWRLHDARWEGQDEDTNLAEYGPKIVDALEAAGRALPAGRFRLWMVEVGGEPAAAHLFVAAGGLVTYWNGGWDERHAKFKPALLSILAAVEEACDAGDDLFDLGAGEQAYKQRFADGDEPLAWSGLILPGPRAWLARARVGARQAGAAAKRALTRTRPTDD
jgi:CelD/BcsL family acetyltransferase involved in cellulose biosynthesis